MTNHKEFRDNWVHSNGTTPVEVAATILPSFFYVFLATSLISLLTTKVSSRAHFIFDFILLIVPNVLNVTLLADYTIVTLGILSLISLSIILISLTFKKIPKFKDYHQTTLPYITNARATINLLSVVAILAVDFHSFPRRHAKTESFGYSLMDLGVGLFIYANGIVSPEILGKREPFLNSLKSSLPLIALGGVRFLITKETDYHVPVSEYGVHWNFFLTLAVTKILTSLILNVIPVKLIFISAIMLMASHEVLLQMGFKNFVLQKAKRDNFFVANKEGLVSALGYVCIYLFSVYFGYLIDVKKKYKNVRKTFLKLVMCSVVTLTLALCLGSEFGISRKLANSAYCFWVLFVGIFMTSLFYGAENLQTQLFRNKIGHIIYAPFIYEAINYNGLAFFLVSNVTTGLINLVCDTVKVSYVFSIWIFILYMFVNCYIVSYLYVKKIKLKL